MLSIPYFPISIATDFLGLKTPTYIVPNEAGMFPKNRRFQLVFECFPASRLLQNLQFKLFSHVLTIFPPSVTQSISYSSRSIKFTTMLPDLLFHYLKYFTRFISIPWYSVVHIIIRRFQCAIASFSIWFFHVVNFSIFQFFVFHNFSYFIIVQSFFLGCFKLHYFLSKSAFNR